MFRHTSLGFALKQVGALDQPTAARPFRDGELAASKLPATVERTAPKGRPRILALFVQGVKVNVNILQLLEVVAVARRDEFQSFQTSLFGRHPPPQILDHRTRAVDVD